MNDELSEYQQKQERLDMLIQEAEAASAKKDYEKVAQLWDEVLQLRKELEIKKNELEAEYQEKQQKLVELSQGKDKASKEQDYEKAAQLRREELLQLQEQIKQRQSKLTASTSHIEELRPELIEVEGINFEIGRGNFVRAATLAEQHQYPLEKVRYLQEMALKRYAFEYQNAPGLLKLIDWYRLSKSDVVRIMNEGLSEHKVHGGLQSVIVDTMRGTTLQQIIDSIAGSKL